MSALEPAAARRRRPRRIDLFNPLGFLLIAGMVVYALKPGLERAVAWGEVLDGIAVDGLVVEGDGLRGVIATERAAIEVVGEEPVERLVIGSAGQFPADGNLGVHYLLSVDAVRRLRGGVVDVLLEVRSAPPDGAMRWQARAAVAGAADTGWVAQTAGRDWSVASLRLAIPETDIEWPLDVMIWSDASGAGGAIELRRLELRPVAPSVTAPATSQGG
jgi:hypothetical protein